MSTGKQPSKARILSNRYKILKKIGKGAFGTAYLVEDLKGSEKYKVLKEIQIGELDPDETVEAIHEAKLLGKLSHSAVLKFYNCFVALPSFCMVTEYCEDGDLDQCICRLRDSSQHLPVSTALRWLIQILLGVEYLHGKRILHRDLKTKNVFLKCGMVKIGDFGISRVLMNSVDMASTFLGTPFFMSPELLKHEGYNAKSDIWSVGCILYEMCALEHAYKGPGLMKILFSICEDPCPTLPERYPRELQSVLERMLQKEPQRRASARELLRVPYLRQQSRQIHNEAASASASGGGRWLLHEETLADVGRDGEGGAAAAAAVFEVLGSRRPRNRAEAAWGLDVRLEELDAEESDDLVPADSWRRGKPAREAAMTNPALADTYYTPDFEDFDDETVRAEGKAGDTDTTLRFARELEAALAQSGRLALEFEDAPDAATSSRFGRDGLDRTVRELRQRCELLAVESGFNFPSVYRYLKASGGQSPSQKASGLRRLTTDSEAAALVEQLVFYEEAGLISEH